ncbi:MAG TPA: TetR/AcrR family transcriptional regulator [Dehalococcoidia bacterium]
MAEYAATGNRLDLIRSAAIDHFSRKGYHGANLREIAADAGIQAGSMYYHYESKEHLLFDALWVSMERLIREVNGAVTWSAPPSVRLEQAVRQHVLCHAEHQAEARVLHNDMDVLTGTYRQRMAERRDEYERIFSRILLDGVTSGEFRPLDVKLAVFAIIAIGQGVSRWYRPDGRLTAREIAEYYAQMVVRAAQAGAPVAVGA